MNLNHLTISGRLGNDPEDKSTSSFTLCRFSLAAAAGRKKDAGTMWLNVSVFGKAGEFCRSNLRKGDSVIVSGRLCSRDWEDRNGNKRTDFCIDASDVQIIPRASGNGSAGNAPAAPQGSAMSPADDGLPF